VSEPAAVSAAGHGPRADLRQAIETGPLTRFQAVAIALCVVLNMLDGFDVLVMAFTAADVAREWGISGARLGVLLSAGLFGMAAGSLFLAPWADRFGRRALILACLGLLTVGMALSALARAPGELAALRVVTGIGIGGILASLNVITSEYSPRRWRHTAISLQVTGYPIGATLGGSLAAVLITRYGWRSAFAFGAAASAVMIPVVVWRLPESIDFLLARRPAGALERLNRVLREMGHPAIATLPPAPAGPPPARNPVGRLFADSAAAPTLAIWCAFFMLMFSFYFVTSWTPKLLVDAGLSTRQGITGGVLLNLGGIAGGSLFGILAARLPLRLLTMLSLGGTAATMLLFGAFATVLAVAFPVALAIGVFLFGAMVGLYATTPGLYAADVRATGMGWAIGIGRLGAILAPVSAGVLVDRGWSATQVYCAFALPLLAAIASVRTLRK
jgi:benzoate transport